MNKNKKMMIGIIVGIVALVGGVFLVKGMADAATTRALMEKVLATVNTEKITQYELDMVKENNKLGGMSMGDQEILSRMVVNKALYLDAVKNGAKADAKNVENLVSAQRSKLTKSGKYAELKKDLKKMHISEKQYWENESKRIKESETKRAYKNTLKVQFANVNQIKDMNALNTKFTDFYNEYTSEVMLNAESKFLVELK